MPACPRIAVALSAAATLAACNPSDRAPPRIARALPAAPAFLAPVEIPAPRAGEDALVVAARERAGRLEANGRLAAGRQAWDALRAAYGGPR